MKTDRELLKEANELIRSFNSVINRKGEQTNWEALGNKTNKILEEQHQVLKPEIHKENEAKKLACPKCGKELIEKYSGVKCSKCDYWFCS